MITQRRVVRLQRLLSTELAGTAIPSSSDAGGTVSKQQFRRVADGLTAPLSSPLRYGMTRLATKSLSLSSCCEWVSWNTACGFFDEEAGTNGSFPAVPSAWAGNHPEQLPGKLPSTSPLLSGALELEQSSTRILHSALPQVPMGICPGTERQHGQGNLYLQYAARDAASDSGR
jgi:hypothetical protein